MRMSDYISWFQSELVYYDAWLWDKSIEQRILRELGTKSDKVNTYNKDRVDLDVLKGSAYKNKTKHDWTTEIWRGITTTAFASIHRDYWSRHTSPRVANYMMFHFALQLLQVICYLLLDPQTTKVTTSDILVPMALGLGLGILHAQITAYDPQRLKRKQPPSPPYKPTADPEPPQSLTPVPLPQPQVNSSNLVEPLSQSKAAPAESSVKEDSPPPNNVSGKSDIQPSSQQLLVAGENGPTVKELLVPKESKNNESGTSKTSNPTSRRTISLKLASAKRDNILSVGQRDQFPVPTSPQPDPFIVGVPESEAGKSEVCHYFRKRSASLNSDFCLSLPAVPLEAKIKHFKEAKLRGVTDSEVLADFQQQLSPKIPKNFSNWEEGVEEVDEDSGSEEPEILDNTLHPIESNNNTKEDQTNLQISTPGEKGPSASEGETIPSRFQELGGVKEATEQLEDEGEEEEDEPEADIDDNDYEDDDVDLNDTFTAHRRQRANFYKIFVQRASHHRHQLQRSHCSRLPEEAQASIESKATAPESMPIVSALIGSRNSAASNATLIPPNRRGSSAAQKRVASQVPRTKVANFMKKNPPIESLSHPASETEYERMNSDVRSEESSSGSDDEQSALRERASTLQAEASISESPTIVATSAPQVKYQPQQSQLKQLSVRTVGLEDVSPSGIRGTAGDLEAIPSPLEEHGGVENTDVTECDAPFVLWYFHAVQGMSDPSYAQSESVSCYVWEGKNMRKSSFTLLDIGWRIIQAVERQKVSNLYPKASVVIVGVLAVLPLFFHVWNQPPCLRPPNASVAIGPLPKDELLTASANPFQTPGTLVLYLCHKIADIMTHVWFPTRESIQADLFWLATPDNLIIGLGIFLRFNIYAVIFFLLCVAERSFQQRHFYAKHFYALTSSHRARRCSIPHLRLNKVAHVKCWLTLRSYLKKRGPQRSVECIVTATFYLAFVFGLGFCYQFLSYGSRQREGVFSSPLAWDILAYTAGLGFFLLRFLTLGLKIAKKFRNISVLISEQLNLHLCLSRKPQKKDELATTNQVLKMAESLLKEVDGPYRICGWAVNPLIYNVFKLVLLSSFSAFISEILGFKLKLYKLKLNPVNW